MPTSNNSYDSNEELHAAIPLTEFEGADSLRIAHGLDSTVAAIQLFQHWILDLQKNNMAHVNRDMPNILNIRHDTSERFFVGIADSHIFLGVPTEEMSWFQGLPWLHVALKKGSDRLNIVSEETTIQNVTLPYFALALHVNNPLKIKTLLNNKNLHIREIELNQYGAVTGVSQSVAFTITIVCVDDDKNIAGLLEKRGRKSFTNRSVFRKIAG